MASYHPASQPSRPSWTRAATEGSGWVRSASSRATASAAPTATRATTQGTAAVRSAHHHSAGPPTDVPVVRAGRREAGWPPGSEAGAAGVAAGVGAGVGAEGATTLQGDPPEPVTPG